MNTVVIFLLFSLLPFNSENLTIANIYFILQSISVNTGNSALECAAETYTKQTILSKVQDYKLFLSK